MTHRQSERQIHPLTSPSSVTDNKRRSSIWRRQRKLNLENHFPNPITIMRRFVAVHFLPNISFWKWVSYFPSKQTELSDRLNRCFRLGHHRQHAKLGGAGGVKGMVGRLSIAVAVVMICTISLMLSSTNRGNSGSGYRSEVSLRWCLLAFSIWLWINFFFSVWLPRKCRKWMELEFLMPDILLFEFLEKWIIF